MARHHACQYTTNTTNTPAVYLEWCVLVLVQEHVELADADPEVPVSELVGDVEAKSTKLSSFQRDAVEHTQ